ncbi:HalOD1 output domain-containing protein [Halolamina sp.]|jgi:hypothetical protein|uniref:HalOD1 output domain-containing protein n=1 Tax=Halolamina sp. TaxID=1940283 RepID=UPI000223C08A|nr:hypothetical protein Halar_3488 [halophilic archaeon DL31]
MPGTRAGIQLSQFEFNERVGRYRAHYDQDEHTTTEAVVAMLSEVMETDPVKIKPLFYSIDPDALNAIFRVRDPGVDTVELTFSHEGYTITVHSHAVIDVVQPHNQVEVNQKATITHTTV